MTTDIMAHPGHRFVMYETVEQPYTVEWEDGQIIQGAKHPFKAEVKQRTLLCLTCDLYLTGWEE
jgi:hypothetical protein